MRSAVAVAVALACLGLAAAQPATDIGSLVSAYISGPKAEALINQLDATETNCQGDGREFLKVCTTDLLRTSSLSGLSESEALSLVDLNADSVLIDGNRIADAVPGATASSGCCDFACKLGKQGCLCPQQTFEAIAQSFSLNGDGPSAARKLMTNLASLCKGQGFNFEAVVFGSEFCTPEYYQSTASNYAC